MKHFELPLLQPGKIAWLQPPPDIHPSSHYSGIAARRIKQDAIEWRHCSNLCRDVTACPIVLENMDDPNPKARHVLFQDLQSPWIAIACNDCSPVFH